jgi:hypothetical protein
LSPHFNPDEDAAPAPEVPGSRARFFLHAARADSGTGLTSLRPRNQDEQAVDGACFEIELESLQLETSCGTPAS